MVKNYNKFFKYHIFEHHTQPILWLGLRNLSIQMEVYWDQQYFAFIVLFFLYQFF